MTTATETQPDTKAEPVLNVACKYGALGLSGDSGTLRVKIDREHMNPMAALGYFCGMQLTGRITQQPIGDDPQQTYLEDAEVNHEVASVFTVGGFRTSPTEISVSLKFQSSSVNVEELSNFPKKTGRLIAELVQTLEDTSDDESDEPDEYEGEEGDD